MYKKISIVSWTVGTYVSIFDGYQCFSELPKALTQLGSNYTAINSILFSDINEN